LETVRSLAVDFISVRDPSRRFVYVSPASEAIVGYPPAELQGRAEEDFIHPHDLERLKREREAARGDEPGEVEYRFRHADGQYRWVETRSRVKEQEDGTRCIVSVTRDVHERRQMELELRRSNAELRAMYESLHEAQDTLRTLAATDELTGLPNRRAILERLAEETARSRRHGRPLCVGVLDVDHFKQVNDTFGHSVGDQTLCGVARAIRACMRREDAAARYGGEEFILVWPETGATGARVAANRLRAMVAEQRFEGTAHCPFSLSVSVGIAEYERSSESLDELISRADEALYAAKASGRNCVCVSQLVQRSESPSDKQAAGYLDPS
jgi:diguanylate cyclase (GGDEF)-like protein/PAS domain S-box-containing protein